MNHYLQYLHKEKLSYCTLYPNVSDHFPLDLSSSGISHIICLKDLKNAPNVLVQPHILADLEASFAPNDLCIFTLDWTVLIPIEDSGASGLLQVGDWFEQAMNNSTFLKKIQDLYTTHHRSISIPLDFDIHDYRDDTPLRYTHIFLIDVLLKLRKQQPLVQELKPQRKESRNFREQLNIHYVEDGWEGIEVPKAKKWLDNAEPSPSYIEASWCIYQQDQILFEIPFSWCSFSAKHDFMGAKVEKPIFHHQGQPLQVDDFLF